MRKVSSFSSLILHTSVPVKLEFVVFLDLFVFLFVACCPTSSNVSNVYSPVLHLTPFVIYSPPLSIHLHPIFIHLCPLSIHLLLMFSHLHSVSIHLHMMFFHLYLMFIHLYLMFIHLHSMFLCFHFMFIHLHFSIILFSPISSSMYPSSLFLSFSFFSLNPSLITRF